MSLFNVPQFIDIEDKIVGPLTAKQLGWIAMGGVVLLVLWNLLDMSAFILAAIPIGAIFGALAFYRPYNQPLIKFLGSSVSFFFRPKIYIWHRTPEKQSLAIRKAPPKKTVQRPAPKKTLTEKKIQELSSLLDQKTPKIK